MYTIKADLNNVSEAVHFIEKQLTLLGHKKDKIIKTELICEEIICQMIRNADEGADINIALSGKGKKSTVDIKCRGQKINLSDTVNLNMIADDFSDEYNEEQESLISDLVLRAFTSNIRLRHTRGLNSASIKILGENTSGSMTTVICLFSGLVFGILLKLILNESAVDFISNNIFSLVSNIFVSGMGIVVAPLVFFSIAESISQFSDMKVFGRIGGKVIAMYCFTTVIAITIGYGFFLLFKPGDVSLLPIIERMSGTIDASQANVGSVTLRSTIINMIPSNFINPFLKADMIQIIVLAVLIGIASKAIGEYSESVQNFIKAGNALFSTMTMYVSKLLPIAVFCLMANLSMTIDLSIINKVVIILLTGICAFACMMLVYSVILLVLGRINPLKFWKNHKDALLVALTTCSSSVTMPSSMKCLDRFGISSKIYSFSIPLGATINMDGASICFVILTLCMARAFGITLNGPALFAFFVTVLFVSAGTPCAAGAASAMMMMLLAQVGVPVGALAFVLPISSMLEFFDTMCNVAGDGVVTAIVAKSERMIVEKN